GAALGAAAYAVETYEPGWGALLPGLVAILVVLASFATLGVLLLWRKVLHPTALAFLAGGLAFLFATSAAGAFDPSAGFGD
ncbi:MAG TPA: hypothetical protein VM370_07690, partial [Candidatus Thermoplasmatota archaeon]|nr:hypothetical protein [Candidatus Thermoplasmatota archaeon]